MTEDIDVSAASVPSQGAVARAYQRYGLSGVIAAVLAVGFLLAPLIPGQFWIYVATEILILGLFAMSFNMLHGYMGQISFGHAAFFGLGAYATGLLMRFFQRAHRRRARLP